ncbi:DUF3298 and DUF4163 domain-containing protein [Bacillus sp. 165]|uniref:DUF3298 and DUF4163 domain-containing protein n=1 Tax=Bacillus sp. 165 TaxID=1529117 RepID=UPI001ADD4B88|nr:DUF3298 and DUF4163 domain-containing protein [Bacillus sp. 165]MBO9130670.1 DUF3298 and DUF4163 domain-containing protein [Bacillus sp. 165]
MKKLLYIAMAIYFCTVLVPKYVFAGHSEPSKAVTIESKIKQKKNDYFEYKLTIPVFTGVANKEFQKQLNMYYKNQMTHFKTKLDKEAKKFYESALQNGWTVFPYTANADYKLTYNKSPLLSLYTNYYQYTGGAHGMYMWKANTFDISLAKELMLDDLFKKNSSYKAILQSEITKQIEQNKENYFPDAIEQVNKTKDFQFFLEPEYLTVYFSLYSIAPYSSGISQFRIPYTLLVSELKPKYRQNLIDN